jgi:hypothetical protein
MGLYDNGNGRFIICFDATLVVLHNSIKGKHAFCGEEKLPPSTISRIHSPKQHGSKQHA